MVAIAAAPLALLAAVLPAPLVLPTLCLIAIAAAGAASWFARHGRFARQAQRHAAWDVAGGLAFIACAAAILSNPEQLIQLVDTGASTTASE